MLKFFKDNFFKVVNIVLLICICCLGIYLRTLAYLQHAPFFIDEAALALNIIDKSYSDLFFGLDYSQAAPPLYCIFCKLWVTVFPAKDFMFKLIPYLSSVFSVIAFVFLARNFLKNRIAILFAVLIFCINPQLIFMSQFYKPYITDVLFSVLLMLFALRIDFRVFDFKKSLITGFIFGMSLWCSYPLLFVVSGISIVLLIHASILKNKDYLKNFFFYCLPIFISFVILYFVNLRTLSSHQGLYNYWQSAFFPTSFLDYQLFAYFFFEYSSWFIFTILFLLGLFFAIKNDRLKSFTVLSSIVVAMLAGALSVYPFANRLILFILPFIILIMAKSLDCMKNLPKILAVLIFVCAFFFVNFNLKNYCLDVLSNQKSFRSENSKILYQVLKQEIKPDEKIYVHHYNYLTFTFYNKELKIDKQNIFNGMISEVDVSKYLDDLNRLPHKTKVWFVLMNSGFSQKELGVILPWIEKNCTVLKKMEAAGAILIYGYRK